MELEEATGGCTLVMRIGVYRTRYASQEAVYLSDLLSELMFPQFSSVQMYEDNMGALQLSGTTTAFSSRNKHICTRYHFCPSWLHRTRSSYLISRQQISWRTFSPSSWTTRSLRPSWITLSTSLLELLYKIIINIRILTCIEGRVFVILLFFACAICSTIFVCLRRCAHMHAFQVFLIRDFYQIHSDMSFFKYMF